MDAVADTKEGVCIAVPEADPIENPDSDVVGTQLAAGNPSGDPDLDMHGCVHRRD